MLYLDPSLLDVDVGSAVFPHGAKLDDVGVSRKITHCEHQVICYEQVVSDRNVRVLVIYPRTSTGPRAVRRNG